MVSKEELAARRGALSLLASVLGAGRMLGEADPKLTEQLSPADRARAGRLTAEVLRHIQRADAILDPYLEKSPPLKARNVMRLAVVEMAELDAPPHGAVGSAVELLRRAQKTSKLAGLGNAVLRRASEGLNEAWEALEPDALPKWIQTPLNKTWGKDVAKQIEAAHAKGAAVDLTPGPLMTPQFRAGIDAVDLPTGSLRLNGSTQITALPGYEEGAFWVQDAAAAMPARILATKPGEKVLDLCAAPGGKTMQLSATGAKVTAVDIAAERMERVEENLARTGLTAKTVTADILKWAPDGPVDAILLDAPCSATGTVRRHPDLPYVKDGSGIRELRELQSTLIDRAASWLRPGGRLVFATCSLLPHEGEIQAQAAMGRDIGLSLDLGALGVTGVQPEWVGEFGLRLRPDYWPEFGGMDGFFVAAFTKD